MLWLAAHFPAFALDVAARGGGTGEPLAVVEGRGRPRIVACNQRAQGRGVRHGMGLAAAWALVPVLRVLRRDRLAEAAALANLAAWAGRFSSLVSLEPPQELLLEIGGSRALLGDPEVLRGRVQQELADLGYVASLAVAPTPLGALCMARAGCQETIQGLEEFPEKLAVLPLDCMGLEDTIQESLRGMGLHRLGDLVRQPRPGLARRFGPQLPATLDRVLGRSPDLRLPFVPPPSFSGRLALPVEVTQTEALLFPLRRLILELTGYLAAIDAGVQEMGIIFQHSGHPETRLALGLVTPSREASHLLDLIRERLEHTLLPAPVIQVGIAADRFLPLAPGTPDLFPGAVETTEEWGRLMDRLEARLGARAVQGLAVVGDWRPERAWRRARPGEQSPGAGRVQRPLWLLAAPRVLAVSGDRPCLNGPLDLAQGPERIESGWWDGHEVARDYFVARSRAGQILWVFRERGDPGRWFLHGLFG